MPLMPQISAHAQRKKLEVISNIIDANPTICDRVLQDLNQGAKMMWPIFSVSVHIPVTMAEVITPVPRNPKRMSYSLRYSSSAAGYGSVEVNRGIFGDDGVHLSFNAVDTCKNDQNRRNADIPQPVAVWL